MSTLQRPHATTMYDVDDVPAFCRGIWNRWRRRNGSAWLRDTDALASEDDMMSHLYEHATRLRNTFDPDRNDSFAAYASAILDRRITDFYRSWGGRTGGRITPAGSWSLDDATHHQADPALSVMDDPEVAGLLDVLSTAQRRIILARIEGVPRAELARRLGVSQKTAALREAWAIQELRVHYPDFPWPAVDVDVEDDEEMEAA